MQFRHNYSPMNKNDKISLVRAILYIRDDVNKKSLNKSRAHVLWLSFLYSCRTTLISIQLSCRSHSHTVVGLHGQSGGEMLDALALGPLSL